MLHRRRSLFRDRQLRSFLPWADGTWLGVRYSDCGAAGACIDELHPIEENKLIVIAISPNDKLGGANE